ncbi:16S rRNA (guanine(527)-N(7))-methyltransferase GidB [Propionibacterium sp. oral taxon 192 str. F0372]|uniref:16S rRNA (guanine(527)-N(7))-methyltransferase RsmG n=1 Tax=Propionibacterium sp. oral taxon 192 TaxID=671222 RepID=UPI0003534F63|nr:16S rRNA (guanine(527)-N(7))-methyltransferase RsmG [Propionibacterium sp. oral taxon 192]EPH06231.1 16S rRNA (guanine(527)-N(7))-methyltransferase GidB [Propionibacterium sp. oral taxon 192 str. F0372]
MNQSPVPDAVDDVFGSSADLAVAYHEILATRGIEWGLIGPREAGRLWSRHILNSAAVAGLPDGGVSVVDVGSGAGLPGIPLALARPDLEVTLLEPMLRRSIFLTGVVGELGIDDRVRVLRGRAEKCTECFDVVTCRAVAGLGKLLGWTTGLFGASGVMHALKGESASQEIVDAKRFLARHRLTAELTDIRVPGAEVTHVVTIRRAR